MEKGEAAETGVTFGELRVWLHARQAAIDDLLRQARQDEPFARSWWEARVDACRRLPDELERAARRLDAYCVWKHRRRLCAAAIEWLAAEARLRAGWTDERLRRASLFEVLELLLAPAAPASPSPSTEAAPPISASLAPPEPTASASSSVGKGAIGPGPDGTFCWQGRVLALGEARHKLVACLWAAPAKTMPIADLCQQTWGNADKSRRALPLVLSRLNEFFARHGVALRVERAGDVVRLTTDPRGET